MSDTLIGLLGAQNLAEPTPVWNNAVAMIVLSGIMMVSIPTSEECQSDNAV